MLKSLWTKLLQIVAGAQPTVDTITAKFKQMETDLKDCAEHHFGLAVIHADAAAVATAAKDDALAEAQRAKDAAAKIAALVG